jgi:hypothetical protein
MCSQQRGTAVAAARHQVQEEAESMTSFSSPGVAGGELDVPCPCVRTCVDSRLRFERGTLLGIDRNKVRALRIEPPLDMLRMR